MTYYSTNKLIESNTAGQPIGGNLLFFILG